MATAAEERRRRNAIALLDMAIMMAARDEEDDVNRPVITVPGAQSVSLDDVPLALDITFSDAVETSLTVELSVTGGTFSLNGTTGLSFTTGDGTSDSTMIFSGTIVNINAACTDLSYTHNTEGNYTLSINAINTTGTRGASIAIEVTEAVVGSYTPSLDFSDSRNSQYIPIL